MAVSACGCGLGKIKRRRRRRSVKGIVPFAGFTGFGKIKDPKSKNKARCPAGYTSKVTVEYVTYKVAGKTRKRKQKKRVCVPLRGKSKKK